MEISVIGLGDMGAALARVLLQAGHRVTIWNRSAAKAAPLVQQGAMLAPSAAAAVSASPVIINCVLNYTATREILGSGEAAAALAGRTLVELSSGTPQDAREAETWVQALGAAYLDGAILATPNQMGRPDTPLFVSGATAAFNNSEPLLKALAGNLQYMGEPVGLASAWDMAFLSCLFGGMLGFIHGARICEAEGIKVSDYGAMMAHISPVIGEMIKNTGDVIASGEFDKPQSSIDMCAGGMNLFVKQAEEAGINNDWPLFASGLFRKAQEAGYGKEEVAALVKVK